MNDSLILIRKIEEFKAVNIQINSYKIFYDFKRLQTFRKKSGENYR